MNFIKKLSNILGRKNRTRRKSEDNLPENETTYDDYNTEENIEMLSTTISETLFEELEEETDNFSSNTMCYSSYSNETSNSDAKTKDSSTYDSSYTRKTSSKSYSTTSILNYSSEELSPDTLSDTISQNQTASVYPIRQNSSFPDITLIDDLDSTKNVFHPQRQPVKSIIKTRFEGIQEVRSEEKEDEEIISRKAKDSQSKRITILTEDKKKRRSSVHFDSISSASTSNIKKVTSSFNINADMTKKQTSTSSGESRIGFKSIIKFEEKAFIRESVSEEIDDTLTKRSILERSSSFKIPTITMSDGDITKSKKKKKKQSGFDISSPSTTDVDTLSSKEKKRKSKIEKLKLDKPKMYKFRDKKPTLSDTAQKEAELVLKLKMEQKRAEKRSRLMKSSAEFHNQKASNASSVTSIEDSALNVNLAKSEAYDTASDGGISDQSSSTGESAMIKLLEDYGSDISIASDVSTPDAFGMTASHASITPEIRVDKIARKCCRRIAYSLPVNMYMVEAQYRDMRRGDMIKMYQDRMDHSVLECIYEEENAHIKWYKRFGKRVQNIFKVNRQKHLFILYFAKIYFSMELKVKQSY